MGTYQFKATALFSRESSAEDWGVNGPPNYPATDAELIARSKSQAAGAEFYHGNTVGVSTGRLVFTGSWYLDGSATPLDINNLPAGFNPTSCELNFKSGGNWSLRSATHEFFVTIAGGLERQLPYPASVTNTVIVHPVPSVPSINSFLTFRMAKIAADGNPGYYNFILSGNYSIISGTFTIAPGPYNTGGEVSIVGSALLDGIDEIQLAYPNPSNPNDILKVTIPKEDFVSQTAFLIVFIIPSGFVDEITEAVLVFGVDNGTQFSGSVLLGTIEILLENGSGIYKITENKTNDTLYTDSSDSDDTTDYKIPNPFAKTGFIGG